MIVIEKTSRGCIILVILVSHVVTPQEQVVFLKMIEAFRQEHWGNLRECLEEPKMLPSGYD